MLVDEPGLGRRPPIHGDVGAALFQFRQKIERYGARVEVKLDRGRFGFQALLQPQGDEGTNHIWNGNVKGVPGAGRIEPRLAGNSGSYSIERAANGRIQRRCRLRRLQSVAAPDKQIIAQRFPEPT